MPADHTLCPIRGCSNHKGADQVVCRQDWKLVPKPLQTEIWFRFRTARGSPEHLAAIREALRVIEEARGPRQPRLMEVD